MHQFSNKFPSTGLDRFLYAIIDKAWVGENAMVEVAEEILLGGAKVLQLRDKLSPVRTVYEEAEELRKLTYQYRVPLIINDRVDVTLAVGADGVHLGQDDLPLSVARSLVGNNMLIGASVHTLEQAQRAVKQGADYLGVGAIYPTESKKQITLVGIELVKQLKKTVRLPIVAIGGIKLENLKPVILAGAQGVAIISDILSTQDIRSRTKAIVKTIEEIGEEKE